MSEYTTTVTWSRDGAVFTDNRYSRGHRWEFDLATGKGLNPTGCQLYEFAVQVVSDEIRVGIPDDGERHHNRFQT